MAKPTDQMNDILEAHKAMGPLPIESLSAEHARQIPLIDRAAVAVYGHHFMKKALAPMPLPVGKVEHRLIPGEGGQMLTRVYTPKGEAPAGGWPVIVYYHGGGWVIATLDTYDSSCRALCDLTQAVVLSVDYRQAPEHPWPAAPTDAFMAYQWACTHAHQIGGNAALVAVAGESAGGNLATVVSLMARDKGAPLPVHQLLVYPVTDLANGMNSASATEYATAKPLNQPMLSWFYNHYLSPTAERTHAYVSPYYASLTGLPSATVILAEIDPLRSEGEAYARKLREAGVPVELKLYEGVTHEFFGLKGLVHEAGEALDFAATRLKNAFFHARETAAHAKAA